LHSTKIPFDPKGRTIPYKVHVHFFCAAPKPKEKPKPKAARLNQAADKANGGRVA
jgi:hypothetical protein